MTNWFDRMPGRNYPVGFLGSRASLRDAAELAGSPGIQMSGNKVTIVAPDKVIEGFNFAGFQIAVRANGVVIRNCFFDGRATDKGNGTIHADTSDNLTVEDCTFEGSPSTPSKQGGWIVGQLSWPSGRKAGRWFVRRCLFKNTPSDGLHGIAGGEVTECFFDGDGFDPGAHSDCIYSNHTVAPLKIFRNTFDKLGTVRTSEPGHDLSNNAFRLASRDAEGPVGSTNQAGIRIYHNFVLATENFGSFLTAVFVNTKNVEVYANKWRSRPGRGPLYALKPGQVVKWGGNTNLDTGENLVPSGVTLTAVPPDLGGGGEEPPPPPPPTEWTTKAFPEQTKIFMAQWFVIPKQPNLDGVMGLATPAAGEVDDFSDLACALRFNDRGLMDVRHGDDYAADATVAYTPNAVYGVQMHVNLETKRYRVVVFPPGVSDGIQLAWDYNFRTQQAGVTALSMFAHRATKGELNVYQFEVIPQNGEPPPPPTGTAFTADGLWEDAGDGVHDKLTFLVPKALRG